jgi:hypothetical protein
MRAHNYWLRIGELLFQINSCVYFLVDFLLFSCITQEEVNLLGGVTFSFLFFLR